MPNYDYYLESERRNLDVDLGLILTLTVAFAIFLGLIAFFLMTEEPPVDLGQLVRECIADGGMPHYTWNADGDISHYYGCTK